MAHPCLADVEATMGKSLTLHTGGNWAGYMPSFSDLSHECADDLNSYIYESTAQTVDDPVPGVPAGPVVSAAGFQVKNLTPLGHSARNVPFTGTGNGVYNSDLAFKDNYVFAGTYEGFRVIDVTNKSNPVQILNYTGCNVGQGDVIVYGNLLIRSWDAEASACSTCAGQLVGEGFEGIHIFDITNPAAPAFIRALRYARQRHARGRAARLRLAHRDRRAGRDSRLPLHLQRRLERQLRRHRHLPDQAVRSDRCRRHRPRPMRASTGTGVARVGNNSCHDNNVLLNVGGTTTSYAMCAGGNGLAMYKFDLTLAPDRGRRRREPDAAVDAGR